MPGADQLNQPGKGNRRSRLHREAFHFGGEIEVDGVTEQNGITLPVRQIQESAQTVCHGVHDPQACIRKGQACFQTAKHDLTVQFQIVGIGQPWVKI